MGTKISELNTHTPDGTEYLECIITPYTPGTNRRITAQQIVNLGGGGGTSIPFGSTSGTNTYTIAATPAVTAYTNGMLLHVKVINGSTNLSTFNFDGVGAKKAYINPETQVTDGMLEDDHEYLFTYDSTLDAAAGGFLMVGDDNHARINMRGNFDASTDTLPPATGSGPSGAVKHGDAWVVVNSGTFGGVVFNNKDLLVASVDSPGSTVGNYIIIAGVLSTDIKLALKQTLINSAVAITDAASMDLTAIKHTLTTSSATRTFTISYTGDDITLEVTLNAASSTFTFPATSLCVSEGAITGDNTCPLVGSSGDKYIISIKKIGSAYYVVCKNFGQ